MDEKFDALVNMVTQLGLTINELRNTTFPYPQQPPHQDLNIKATREDKTIRVDIHEFDGTSHDPEVYIEWEKGVERYFELRETHPAHQYKVAKVKLTRLAATWLEGIQRQRARKDKPKIHSWEKLRKHLRRKYIPTNYKKIEVMKNLTYEGACNSALILEKSARRRAAPAHTFNKARETSSYKLNTHTPADSKGPAAQHSSKVGETQQHAPIVKTIHVDNVEINNPPLQVSSTCTTLHVDNVEMNGFYFMEDEITHTFHSSFKPSAQKPARHLPTSSSIGSHLPLISTTQPYNTHMASNTERQLTTKEKEVNPKDDVPPTKTTQTPTHLLGKKECDAKDDSVRHITKITFYKTIKLHGILQNVSSYNVSNLPSTLLSNFCTILSTRCIFRVAYDPQTHNQNKIPYETLRNAFNTLIQQNTRDEHKTVTHEGFAHSGYPHLHFEHFSFACMYDLNHWHTTTLVHL